MADQGVAGIYKTKAEAQKVARLLEKTGRRPGGLKIVTRYIILYAK